MQFSVPSIIGKKFAVFGRKLGRNVIFAYLGGKGGNRIVMKFCIGVKVPDIITHAI